MKKTILIFITVVFIGVLFGFSLSPLDLKDAPLTEQLLREVEYRNSLVRGYSWLPTTPSALPIAPDVFMEDTPWEFDFAPYITGTTPLDSLQIGWSQSTFFSVEAPYPAQPFKLRFTPAQDFFGTKPMWITIYRITEGVLSGPVSKGINITVTNQPDVPTFHFPTYDTPDNVAAGHIYEVIEDSPTGITLNFANIVRIYDGSSYTIYITQTTFPNKIDVIQNPGNDKLVTFIPIPDYHGRQHFIVTAVENLSGGATQHVSTTFSIDVVNVNDPPVIDTYWPSNDPTFAEQLTSITIDQDDAIAFGVTASDADGDAIQEPLYYTWTLEGELNGVPFSRVESTNSTLNYTFNVPGFYVLTCDVRDRMDNSGYSVSHVWNITVSPMGPWFDPYGSNNTSTFSTSQNVVLSTPGVDNTTIYYYATAVPPVVPNLGSLAEPLIYNGAINIPVPPQDYVFTITAWFTHPVLPTSQHVTQIYNMTGKVDVPQFVEAEGIISSNVDYPVHITSGLAGATLYYSYNDGPWTIYNAITGIPVPPQSIARLRAYASKDGWDDSDVTAEHVYDVRRKVVFAAPTLNTIPLPDGDGNYCVCLNDAVVVDFTVPATIPPDAIIYYSINGVVSVYDPADFPMDVYSTSTFQWWAEYTDSDPDYFSSDVFTYQIPILNRTRMTFWGNGNDSVFNPPQGTYTTGQNVFINTETLPLGAPIYYSLNGAPYQLYNGGAIFVAANSTIEAYAEAMPVTTTLNSLHQTATYTITGTLPTPIISPAGYPSVAMYESNVDITISLPLGDPRWADADIYYTYAEFPAVPPTPDASSTLYAGSFNLPQGHWRVRAIAILNTWEDSSIAAQNYYIKFLPQVTFMPTNELHFEPINVQMFAYDGATIRFTDDGTEPHAGSPIYSPQALLIDQDGEYSKTYKAKAYRDGWVTSDTAQKIYTMRPTVINPVFSPLETDHAVPVTVTIATPTPGAQIYYTLDGSDPTQASTLYSGAFVLGTTTTLRARAYKAGFRESDIVQIEYVIGNDIGALVFQPAPGDYTTPIDVVIFANPPAAQIYYTTNGDEPTIASTLYAGPIHLDLNSLTTIKAIAVLENWTPSTGQATYNITGVLEPPSINPSTSAYTQGTVVPVTITAPVTTPDAEIWYTVNGGAPQQYVAPFDVNVNTTLVAWAEKPLWIDSPTVSATYTFNGQLNAPVITPVSGQYSENIQVRIYNYQDATIYYSLDNGATYNEYTFGIVGFTVNKNTIVKAYASKANWQDSPVVTHTYNMKVPNPVFDPNSGSFATQQQVTISVSSGDDIYYTLDGSNPTLGNPNSVLYSGPITVGIGYTRIRAAAHRADWISSDFVEAIYNVNGQLSKPVFSLAGGLYYENQQVTILSNPSNANIYYTIDGTEPDESSTPYGGTISIQEITTLKAKAYLPSWIASEVESAVYDLKVKPITSNVATSGHTSAINVPLSTETDNTVIYYTTNGDVPGPGSLVYAAPIPVSATTRIRARAYRNDGLNWIPSDIFDQTFSISQQVATPVFTPAGGVFGYSPVNVTITCATPGATIYYAYEGEGWQVYNGSIAVNNSKVIYAKAELDTWVPSPVVYAHYIISIPVVAKPMFEEVADTYYMPGTYNNAVDVKIVTQTVGAQIYYTLDGSDPTEADILYAGPFTINATTTVKAKAFNAPMTPSEILVGTYRIEPLTVLAPVIVPEDDSNPFYEPFFVFLYPRTVDSVVYYTLDGSEPTELDNEYTAAFMLNQTTTVKAKAFKNGVASDTVTRNYLVTGKVNISGVSITPASGNYTAPITISTIGNMIPADAVLRYTTDGSNPTNLSPLFDDLNPPMNSSLNLKLRGFKDNWLPSDVISASYTFTGQVMLSANLFSIDPLPVYTSSLLLTLDTVTSPVGATLRYTLDGSVPTQLSPAYVAGYQIPVNSTTTVNVIGFLDNWTPSEMATATYTISGQVTLGNVTPVTGTYNNPQNVSIELPNPNDASVFYTTDGTDPIRNVSSAYAGVFTIDANDVIDGLSTVEIRVKGFRDNWDDSQVSSTILTFQAATPGFDTPAGSYPVSQILGLNSTTVGAEIRYTTDGSDPTLASTLYTVPIAINQSMTVKARAFNNDYLPSPIASATYVIGTNQLVALPTFSPIAGTYDDVQYVRINCATPGAAIYYRTDGIDPTEADTPFTDLSPSIEVGLNSTLNIKARAFKVGHISSQVASATFIVTGQVAPVAFDPMGGNYTTPKQVVLTTLTPGAYILYSTDGSAPSIPYTNAIYVAQNSSMTITAQAFKDGWADSVIGSQTYTITGSTAFNQPLLSPAPGTFTNDQLVTIANPVPPTAQVWYTLDGSIPDPANPNAFLYTGNPILINGNANLQVAAFEPGWDSQVFGNNVYTFNAEVPAYNPTPGYYADPINVQITSATLGSTIYYTMNGDNPTIGSDIYNAQIPINGDTTFKAFAWKAGYNPSPIVTGIYGLGGVPIPTVASPVLDPPPGTYSSPRSVNITTATPGASIRYTLNGDIPTSISGMVYDPLSPIQLNSDSYTMIRAIAYMEDGSYNPSSVVTGEYTITGDIADVTFNPPAGTYASPQTVFLSSATPGVYFRYTTDGTDPNASSQIYNSNGIYLGPNSSTMIKAIAYRNGWTPSEIGTAVYNIRAVSFSLNPLPANYNNEISVQVLNLNPANADVYYSIDGSVPTIPYTGGIMLNGGISNNGIRNLRVKAELGTWATTEVNETYVFNTSAPTLTPPPAVYTSARFVSLASLTNGATIRYTTNGDIPSETTGTIYNNELIPVTENLTIRTIAYKEGYTPSSVVTATYAIGTVTPVVANPVFTPGTTTSFTPITIELSTTTPNADIYYTTNGDDPTVLSTPYNPATPIVVPFNTNMFLKARAYRENWLPSAVVSANYVVTGTVSDVTFSHPSGTYQNQITVLLGTTTDGATIRYTTDGTEPNLNSPQYFTGIPVPLNTNNIIITAKAFRSGWLPSQSTSRIYTVTGQVLITQPVFTPDPTVVYTSAPVIVIGNTTPAGATVRYTTDGTDPTPTSNIYSPGSIIIPQAASTTVKVQAFLADWDPSPVYSAVYTVTGQVDIQAISFDPPAGTYPQAIVVHLEGNTDPAGAILRYTLNGGEPNELSPAYNAVTGIPINSTSVLRIKGFLNGWTSSETKIASYVITGQVVFNPPVFTPAAGEYTTAQNIIIGTTTPAGATRRYTVDGSEPTATSPIYNTGDFINAPLNSVTTIKVKAFLDDWTSSETQTAMFNITGQVQFSGAVFSPAPDSYTTPIDVVINTSTSPADATIRYTTDGSDPNETSPEYTQPIPVLANQSVTIRVKAFKAGWTPSIIHTGVYNVTGQVHITGTVFTPDPSVVYTSAQSVVISTTTNTLGATIRYTTDGNEPGETSPEYTQPIPIGLNSITEIKVKAFKSGWTSSPTYSAIYTVTGQVNIAAVSIIPASNTYQTLQTVTTTGSLVPSDAVLRYTTDGTDPVATSPLFTSLNPPLNSTLNLKIRGFKPDWIPSAVLSANYTFTGQVVLSTPMFSPIAGTYSSLTSVTLNQTTIPAGATLRYTLNGADPTESSPAYSAAIPMPMNATTTLKVRGFLAGWTPSAVLSAQYVITGALDIAAPQFTPAQGLYYEPQSVSLGNSIILGTTTAATGATIRYTTDGTEPTATSTAYNPAVPIAVNATSVLKIKAFKADWISSPTYEASYQITGQVSLAGVTVTPAAGLYQVQQTITYSGNPMPSDAVMRYTTDGSDPTEASPVFISLSPSMNSAFRFKVRGFKAGWLPSEVMSLDYIFTGQLQFVGTVFNPDPSIIYTTEQNVVVSTTTNMIGSVVRYTLDGTEPTETSAVYSGPIPLGLNSVTTVKVKAYREMWLPSETRTAIYTVTGKVSFAGQMFTLEPGTYTSAQSVGITASVYPSNATIHYTTDGSDPTLQSDVYTSGMTINLPLNSQTTIKAKAFNPNWIDSDIIEASYQITGQVLLSENSLTPAPGLFTTQQSVSIASATLPTDGVVIRYTLDGTEPTVNSPAYVSPIVLQTATTTQIRIRGFANGWIPSNEITGTYTITGTVATPVFSHPGNTIYGAAFKLGISCATPEATIRYTLDGSDVTATSPVYADSISIGGSVQDWTIKAKAFKTDWVDSQQSVNTFRLLLSPINVWTEIYDTHIRVLWNAPSVTRGLDGFNVYRKKASDNQFPVNPLNSAPVMDMIGGNYYYDDYAIENNVIYHYMVKAVYDGVESPPSNIQSGQLISANLIISETSNAYPNPAETSTTVKVVLTRNDNVQVAVSIYDFAGKKIRTLSVPTINTNKVEIVWDLKNSSGTKVARGVYFANVVVSDSTSKQEKVIKIAVK